MKGYDTKFMNMENLKMGFKVIVFDSKNTHDSHGKVFKHIWLAFEIFFGNLRDI